MGGTSQGASSVACGVRLSTTNESHHHRSNCHGAQRGGRFTVRCGNLRVATNGRFEMQCFHTELCVPMKSGAELCLPRKSENVPDVAKRRPPQCRDL